MQTQMTTTFKQHTTHTQMHEIGQQRLEHKQLSLEHTQLYSSGSTFVVALLLAHFRYLLSALTGRPFVVVVVLALNSQKAHTLLSTLCVCT